MEVPSSSVFLPLSHSQFGSAQEHQQGSGEKAELCLDQESGCTSAALSNISSPKYSPVHLQESLESGQHFSLQSSQYSPADSDRGLETRRDIFQKRNLVIIEIYSCSHTSIQISAPLAAWGAQLSSLSTCHASCPQVCNGIDDIQIGIVSSSLFYYHVIYEITQF